MDCPSVRCLRNSNRLLKILLSRLFSSAVNCNLLSKVMLSRVRGKAMAAPGGPRRGSRRSKQRLPQARDGRWDLRGLTGATAAICLGERRRSLRGQRGGPPKHQARVQFVFVVLARSRLALDLVQESLEGDLCQLLLGHLHGCERRGGELGQSDIVKTDHGKVIRYSDVVFVGFAHESNC